MIQLFALVLDCSSLIPCSEKSEEMKEAIRWLGSVLCNLDCATVYFSPHLIKIYYSKVAPLLKSHHPLPLFQANLLRVLGELRKITSKSRGLMCKIRLTEKGVKFHVLETAYLQSYNVDDMGLTEEEDKEVLRIALASASMHQKVFLVTTNHHFLEDLNRIKLLQRYPNEGAKIELVTPENSNFKTFLISCSH